MNFLQVFKRGFVTSNNYIQRTAFGALASVCRKQKDIQLLEKEQLWTIKNTYFLSSAMRLASCSLILLYGFAKRLSCCDN